MTAARPLRIAFIHPDLGIGGAERLVVDAALGLQGRGHTVDIYTSHHDERHCFEETRDGRLRVHHVAPPLPRAWRGKCHILFAHARQLHLTWFLLRTRADAHDVFLVDQLSTCVPFLRLLGGKRVVFYCHFPDKLLAGGVRFEGAGQGSGVGVLKKVYRYPMDWLEEVTTRQADVVLANSKFTAKVAMAHFSTLERAPRVVYPGVNTEAYRASVDRTQSDVVQVTSWRPTLLSLNRFEMKKNAALAIETYGRFRRRWTAPAHLGLVLAGGYDPRLEDNVRTLNVLVDLARQHKLTFTVITPAQSSARAPAFADSACPDAGADTDVVFLLNFTSAQRSALLQSGLTRALLYTPINEHFGIGPVEGMLCGLPVLACDSGGPTESIVEGPLEQRTGWLRAPDPDAWADALEEICSLTDGERAMLAQRCRERAEGVFGMGAMAEGMEAALVEAVGMGHVGMPLKELGFLLAFVTGLALAVYM